MFLLQLYLNSHLYDIISFRIVYIGYLRSLAELKNICHETFYIIDISFPGFDSGLKHLPYFQAFNWTTTTFFMNHI